MVEAHQKCIWKRCRLDAAPRRKLCEKHFAEFRQDRSKVGQFLAAAGPAIGYGLATNALYDIIMAVLEARGVAAFSRAGERMPAFDQEAEYRNAKRQLEAEMERHPDAAKLAHEMLLQRLVET